METTMTTTRIHDRILLNFFISFFPFVIIPGASQLTPLVCLARIPPLVCFRIAPSPPPEGPLFQTHPGRFQKQLLITSINNNGEHPGC